MHLTPQDEIAALKERIAELRVLRNKYRDLAKSNGDRCEQLEADLDASSKYSLAMREDNEQLLDERDRLQEERNEWFVKAAELAAKLDGRRIHRGV